MHLKSFRPVILSRAKRLQGVESSVSKDPEDASSAMPTQGVPPKLPLS